MEKMAGEFCGAACNAKREKIISRERNREVIKIATELFFTWLIIST